MNWTTEELEYLRQRYPYEHTRDVARALGRTMLAVINMAGRLHLNKVKGPKLSLEKREELRKLFPDHTYYAIALRLGISYSTVTGLVKAMGLSNTLERKTMLMSKLLKQKYAYERVLRYTGDGKMKHKVLDANHKLTAMQWRLLTNGYIIDDDNMNVYYEPGMKRHRRQERNAEKMGIVFKPYNIHGDDAADDDTETEDSQGD